MDAGAKFIEGILAKRGVTIFLSLCLLVVGAFSFATLPLEPYPGVSPLNVQVITQWPGRSTLEVERQLTVPIETSMTGIRDIQAIRSVSMFGLSVVTIRFRDGAEAFRSRQDVQLFLDHLTLPAGVTGALSPDSDATGEIMRYWLEGKNVDLATLKSYQDWDIYKALRYVSGISEITGFGGMVKQYQVIPDPTKLLSFNVSLNQFVDALANSNANVGGGLIDAGEQQYTVRAVGLLRSLADIRNVVVGVNQDVPVRVSDLADVRIGNAPRLGMVKFNRHDDVVEGVVLLRKGANASEVLAKVHEKIIEINRDILPGNIQIRPFYDRQALLDLTSGTVEHTLVLGMSIVFVVLFLFLGDFKAAVIVAAVIPFGLSVSFFGMLALGVSANLISLGAIDFGVIVDSSVVVMENIMRQLEEGGASLKKTIVSAVTEVQRAIVFATIIIITVYSPLIFFGGVEGKIFKPMAFTMGFAVLSSLMLSQTFLPAATSMAFKQGMKPHSPKFITAILNAYQPLIRLLIRIPGLVVTTAFGVLCVALWVAVHLGTEFLPTLEENNLWLRITLPNTVDLSYSAQMGNKIRDYFIQHAEIDRVSVQIGRPDDGTDPTGAFNLEFGLFFKHPDQWPEGMTKPKIVERFEDYLHHVPGITYQFSQYIQDAVAEAISGVKGENAVKIFGSDLEILQTQAFEVLHLLKKVPGVVDTGVYRELGQPTLNVVINRTQCARFGLNVTDVENVVLYAVGGNPITTILEGERTFNLALRFPETERNSIEKIRSLYIDTPDKQRVPMSMVADVEMVNGPFFIYREGGRRYIPIRFGVRGRDLGSAAAEIKQKFAEQLKLPPGYTMTMDGNFNQMKKAQGKLAIILPVTLSVIFLLLYLNTGTLRDAAMILLNVPMATIGGIAALYLAGETLSISAGIGFLSLFGIAIQDGVILISYVKKLAEDFGNDLERAVVQGASLRLRPVVMTAMASMGLLPAALAHGVGSQAQRPLALVIVGGMVSTTILTLLVLPVIFYWVHTRWPKVQETPDPIGVEL
jgi:cobalt-zinc-cadmium resistance protein CzcA